MVKHALLVVAAHAALLCAHARGDDYVGDEYIAEKDDSPAFNMFGFDMEMGFVPHDGANALAMSLGLAVEHPVFTKTRVFGEYDWLWLSPRDSSTRAMIGTSPRPERHASGHRASLGLRRELKAKGGGHMRLFIDGELGGGLALVNDSMAGATLAPSGFIGLRFGYDLYSRRDSSPSRMFETALVVRAVGVRDGLGIVFGLGMYWGN